MKLKSTLGLAIGSLLAVSSFGVFAQGQGAVEAEVFAKRYFTDSYRDMDDGNLYGGSVGYFLTDDVSLNLSYGEYKSLNHDSYMDGTTKIGSKKAYGSLSSLDAVYHFGTPGIGLRPYLSAGLGHQSISQTARSGRDHTTFANIGAGAKYYFTENVFAKASVDGMHGFDNHQSEWMAGVGIGVNFGGKPAAAPYVEPVAAVVEPVVYEEVEAEPVRVELDVKFDFDKANVKQDSYSDIENLAEFMKQFPQTATTVEGHTDSVGNAAYNQKLSERRAGAVRDALVNQYGVEAERINAVGYGKERPVADNATSEGRAINRRVEASVEAQAE
jgi:OOP family OmpA-OmpF porin